MKTEPNTSKPAAPRKRAAAAPVVPAKIKTTLVFDVDDLVLIDAAAKRKRISRAAFIRQAVIEAL